MSSERRFLIAPSLARLVQRELGSAERRVDGYFPASPNRIHFVSIEPAQCWSVLVNGNGEGAEDRVAIPRVHAEALLGRCAGRLDYERIRFPAAGSCAVLIDRLARPGPAALIRVVGEDPADLDGFVPPPWFGPDVTDDPAYRPQSIALTGLPPSASLPLSDAAVDALLDALDGTSPGGRTRPTAAEAEPDPLTRTGT